MVPVVVPAGRVRRFGPMKLGDLDEDRLLHQGVG